jgi:hypothetical protein
MSTLLDTASLIVTPNAYKEGKLYSVVPSNGDGDFTATRATTATRVNSEGLVESVASNIPRLEYSLGSCPNLLLEPQRTNLLLQSNGFSSSSWLKYQQLAGLMPIITPNYAVSPDGTLNASRVIFNANGTAPGDRSTIRQSTALTINTKYSTSIWVKSATGLPYTIEIYATYGNAFSLQINVTNEWVRYEMPNIDSLTTTTGFTNIGIWNNSIKAINTIADVLIWGAQLEAGANPTSYIPTTSASVTRNADSITRNNIYTNGLITSSGGTWFSHLLNNTPKTGVPVGDIGLRLTNVDGNNMFHISTSNGSNQRYRVRKIVGGTNISIYNTLTNEIKVAIKWNGTTADVFVNGIKVVDATAFTSVDLENLTVSNGNTPYNINAMALWPTPLTDTQCIELTTL